MLWKVVVALARHPGSTLATATALDSASMPSSAAETPPFCTTVTLPDVRYGYRETILVALVLLVGRLR